MFLLISVVLCFKFRLKLKDTDLYMGGSNLKTPQLSSFVTADTFLIEKESDSQMTYIVAENKDNQILDIEGAETKLIYYDKRNKGKNQLFIIALGADGAYKLYVMGDCIGYSEMNKQFERVKCNDNDINQSFEILPVFLPSKLKSLFESPLFDNLNLGNSILNNASTNKSMRRQVMLKRLFSGL
ncbi:hypothetical protein DMUE_2188 [Dictyocoela muelleri]|nr:hypothetical protein DMUE_2188 [Dictyocoela muelleri]